MEPTQRITGFPSLTGRAGVSLSALTGTTSSGGTRAADPPTNARGGKSNILGSRSQRYLVGSRVFVFCPVAVAVMFPL